MSEIRHKTSQHFYKSSLKQSVLTLKLVLSHHGYISITPAFSICVTSLLGVLKLIVKLYHFTLYA